MTYEYDLKAKDFFKVKIKWIIKKACTKPVLLIHSPFLLPSFLGGKRQGGKYNQLSYI
jgi:hypothetical protein